MNARRCSCGRRHWSRRYKSCALCRAAARVRVNADREARGSWYSRLTPEQRAAVIARSAGIERKRRADARAKGRCKCGGKLRMVNYRGPRLSSRCAECDRVRSLKRKANATA